MFGTHVYANMTMQKVVHQSSLRVRLLGALTSEISVQRIMLNRFLFLKKKLDFVIEIYQYNLMSEKLS